MTNRGSTTEAPHPQTPPMDPADRTGTEAKRLEAGHTASAPTDIPVRGWKQIGKRTLGEIGSDRVPMMSAAVAFSMFLSLFPALIAAVSVYGLLVDPSTAVAQAQDLTRSLPEDAASLIVNQMSSLAETGNTAAGIGFVIAVLGALWGASGGMSMLLKGVSVAYDEEDTRGFVKNKALALGFALGFIVFIGVVVLLLAVVPYLLRPLGPFGTVVGHLGRWIVLAALIMAALSTVYRFAPPRSDAQWRWVTPGSVVATALWLAASAGFSWFVSSFGSYHETYGAMAGVVVLLLWLQITALSILIGAEVNAEAERQTLVDTTVGEPKPMGERGATAADTPPPDMVGDAPTHN